MSDPDQKLFIGELIEDLITIGAYQKVADRAKGLAGRRSLKSLKSKKVYVFTGQKIRLSRLYDMLNSPILDLGEHIIRAVRDPKEFKTSSEVLHMAADFMHEKPYYLKHDGLLRKAVVQVGAYLIACGFECKSQRLSNGDIKRAWQQTEFTLHVATSDLHTRTIQWAQETVNKGYKDEL